MIDAKSFLKLILFSLKKFHRYSMLASMIWIIDINPYSCKICSKIDFLFFKKFTSAYSVFLNMIWVIDINPLTVVRKIYVTVDYFSDAGHLDPTLRSLDIQVPCYFGPYLIQSLANSVPCHFDPLQLFLETVIMLNKKILKN